MIYTDRSRMETGFKCPRKRFHNYANGGRGFVPAGESQDLWFGKLVHGWMERATSSNMVTPETFPFTEYDVTADGLPLADEWNALAEGLVTTFRQFTLPQILDEYEWVGSEEEMSTLLSPDVTLMSRLDGVLRRRADGLYFVLEAKTSSWPDQLMKQARTNFQLLLECEALRRSLPADAEIGGAVLLVFNKGQGKKDYKGEGFRRLSPFTYTYARTLASGLEEYSLDYKKGAGWGRVPTWTIPGWYDIALERFPEVVKNQVQVWPSIDFDPVRVESVIRQVVAGELRFAADGLVDEVWPQNFGNCGNDGGFGKTCAYWDLCYSPRIAANPVGSGEWKERNFNHPQEDGK